jgi:hypothetical protein
MKFQQIEGIKMAYEWESFIKVGDDWIVVYSLTPLIIRPSVKIFFAGQAFELYLKAAYTKLTGNIDNAIKFRHDLPKIWEKCKKLDPNFLPEYELRQKILDRNLFDPLDLEKLSKDDQLHYSKYNEIYLAAKYLTDLKYVGVPLKKVKGALKYGAIFPNPTWSGLFNSFRNYLEYPEPGETDRLQLLIENGNLPPYCIGFLRHITG